VQEKVPAFFFMKPAKEYMATSLCHSLRLQHMAHLIYSKPGKSKKSYKSNFLSLTNNFYLCPTSQDFSKILLVSKLATKEKNYGQIILFFIVLYCFLIHHAQSNIHN